MPKLFLCSLVFLLGLSKSLGQPAVTDPQWVLKMSSKHHVVGFPSLDFLPVKEGQSAYLLDVNGGKKAVAYDSISFDYGQFWRVWKTGHQGYFHLQNGEVLPPVYHSAILAEKSDKNWAFAVGKYGMYAVVNDRNKLVLPYSAVGYGDFALIGDSILQYKTREVSLVSRSGNPVKESMANQQRSPSFQRVSSSQYVFERTVKGTIVRDTFSAAEPFTDGVATVKRDTLFGYLRSDGTWLVKPRFQLAHPFNASGYAVVKEGGKYGLLRKNGSYAIAPKQAFLKPFSPDMVEYKENGKIGLLDSLGKVMLTAGEYKGFSLVGTENITARSGDSLLIFTKKGVLLPLKKVAETSGKTFGPAFTVALKQERKSYYGVLNADGTWLIPNTLTQPIKERKYFFIAEAVASPCCLVGSLNIGSNQPGKFLIFGRDGQPLVTFPVDGVAVTDAELPFVIFTRNKKMGLVTNTGFSLDALYDELKHLGNGWFYVKNGQEEGALKWELKD
ncbi:MAG: WG repeat-containing protein [Saprospiraceae bacterium]|nr:WG repeat-containing protein [Saprospiraceae bacterium]